MQAPADQPGTPEAGASRRDWNAAAAIIAALIGLLALVVSGYTAMLQRQQVRAEVWPYLQSGISPSQRTVSLENKGVGPAMIRGIEIYVDGKPQRDWRAVFTALGLPDLANTPYSTINGVVLAAGERVQQLSFKDTDAFVRFYAQYPRIQMNLCYCSALQECWQYDERLADRGRDREPVDRCPAPGPNEFVDNRLAVDVESAVR
jgi:hypothetical protein